MVTAARDRKDRSRNLSLRPRPDLDSELKCWHPDDFRPIPSPRLWPSHVLHQSVSLAWEQYAIGRLLASSTAVGFRKWRKSNSAVLATRKAHVHFKNAAIPLPDCQQPIEFRTFHQADVILSPINAQPEAMDWRMK